MTARLALPFLGLGALVQCSCTALTTAGAIIAGAKGAYDFASDVSAYASAALVLACDHWQAEKGKAAPGAAAAVVIGYGDGVPCDGTKPPGSPMALAVWLAERTGQLASMRDAR